MAKDPEIGKRMARVKEIIEQLDTGDCSPTGGENLYEEGQQVLAEVREILDEGDGEIIEIE